MQTPIERGQNGETLVKPSPVSREQLEAELAELRLRLEESEETIHAIHTGAVDAQRRMDQVCPDLRHVPLRRSDRDWQ